MSIKNISKAKNLVFIWNVGNEWELKQYNPFFICQIHDNRYMEIKSNTWKLKKNICQTIENEPKFAQEFEKISMMILL